MLKEEGGLTAARILPIIFWLSLSADFGWDGLTQPTTTTATLATKLIYRFGSSYLDIPSQLTGYTHVH
jgi:hypothetical protein